MYPQVLIPPPWSLQHTVKAWTSQYLNHRILPTNPKYQPTFPSSLGIQQDILVADLSIHTQYSGNVLPSTWIQAENPRWVGIIYYITLQINVIRLLFLEILMTPDCERVNFGIRVQIIFTLKRVLSAGTWKESKGGFVPLVIRNSLLPHHVVMC